MFTAICPHCSYLYKLDNAHIGRRATCKQCRNVFVLKDAPETHDATVGSTSSSIVDAGFDFRDRKPANANSADLLANEPEIWNVGDVILGTYEVKPIAEGVPQAEGGVGVVNRVYHREWDMDLAVKSPKPKFFQTEHGKKSYEQEAQTWVELGLHPNIVTCYLVRRIGGVPRLFAEFVPDGNLRDWILDGRLYHGGKDVALLRILNIAIQFAWGLDHAHRQSLLHLDVKPANVMMSDQTAKVSDFGLAQTAMSGSGEERDSENYITIGMTPGYCSPEQYLAVNLMKEQKFDQLPKFTVQTDIWSWAVSIMAMFFGGPPCNKAGGQNALAVFREFLDFPPSKRRPAVPKTAAKLLMQCFEDEPAKRPESMDQIADELIKVYREVSGAEFPRSKPVNTAWTPDNINNKAASLLDLGKSEEAMKLFNQAIALQPWHPAVTYNRAILSWRRAQLTDVEVIEQLKTLTKQRPKVSDAAYALGSAQRERGNLSAALEAFSDALTMEERDDVRHAIVAAKSQKEDEARRLEIFTLSDLPERKVYVCEKGEFILFYSEPKTLSLHSALTGQLRRTFKIPEDDPKGRKQFALSNDLHWELHAVQDGFSMRRIGTPSTTYLFQKVNWGRHFNNEKKSNQVLLVEKALLGDAIQNRVDISDLETKRKYGTLLGHEDDITALAFDLGGKFAITAGNDRTLRLWELSSCRCLRTFTTSKQMIDAVFLDPKRQFALSLTPNGVLGLWSVAILCCAKPFRAPLKLSLVTSAEEAGRQQSEMGQLCEEIRQSIKRKDYAAALDWLEKAKTRSGWETVRHTLEIGGIGDKIRRHTLRESFDSALCTHTLSGHQDSVTSIAISLDANLIASAGRDGEIRVWNIAEQKCVAHLQEHQDSVQSIAMTTDAKYLVSGGQDGSVRIWNIKTGQTLRTFGERITTLTKIALNPHGQTVAIADAGGTIFLWNVPENSVISRFSCQNNGVNALRFSRDGHYLASGGNDGSVMIWQVGNKELNHTFRDHTSPVTAVALSVDMSRCFSADQSGRIIIRNLLTHKQEQVLHEHLREISGLELLADSRFLFSAAKDGSIKVWNQAEPITFSSIEGNPATVTAMRSEISGRRLVTGGADGVVRVWELLWNCRFPGWQPMTAAAKPVLRSLMSLYSEDGTAKPKIDEVIANRIVLEMGYCGFGTIPAETLKQAINHLSAHWVE